MLTIVRYVSSEMYRNLDYTLTQIPASNDEKYFYLCEIGIFKIELFQLSSIYHKIFYEF